MNINVERKGDKLHVVVTFKKILYKGGRNRAIWRTANVLAHLKNEYPQYTLGPLIKEGHASNFEPEKRRSEWIFKLIPRQRKSPNIPRPKVASSNSPGLTTPEGRDDRRHAPVKKAPKGK